MNPISGGPACTSTYQPGRYTTELQINNNQTACFAPGLYYMQAGFTSNGNAQLYGNGVFFFIDGGGVTLNGTGRLELLPVSNAVLVVRPALRLAGHQHLPGPRQHEAAQINGNDNSSIGTIYLPERPPRLPGQRRIRWPTTSSPVR